MVEKKIKAIIFDLDDTLSNTWETLTPLVMRSIAENIASLGINCTDEQVSQAITQYQNKNLRRDLVTYLFDSLGIEKSNEKLATSLDKIKSQNYNIDDISSLKLHSEVKPILSELKSKYPIYLVTEGNPEVQKNKVKHLGLSSFFSNIYYIDKLNKKTKISAFSQILQSLSLVPDQILCVGNRVDREILEAKKIGIKTCWVKQGPYKNRLPIVDNEIPDFSINHLRELISTCKL